MRASIRERKLVQRVLEGKSVRQAAKEAGYAKSTAEVKSYGILKRPRVQSLLPDALEQAGIMPDRLAQVLADPLDATKMMKRRKGQGRCPIIASDWTHTSRPPERTGSCPRARSYLSLLRLVYPWSSMPSS